MLGVPKVGGHVISDRISLKECRTIRDRPGPRPIQMLPDYLPRRFAFLLNIDERRKSPDIHFLIQHRFGIVDFEL